MSEYRKSLQWFIDHLNIKTSKDDFEKYWHKGELEKLISQDEDVPVIRQGHKYYCYSCDYKLKFKKLIKYNYCPNCGQRLDWNNYE